MTRGTHFQRACSSIGPPIGSSHAPSDKTKRRRAQTAGRTAPCTHRASTGPGGTSKLLGGTAEWPGRTRKDPGARSKPLGGMSKRGSESRWVLAESSHAVASRPYGPSWSQNVGPNDSRRSCNPFPQPRNGYGRPQIAVRSSKEMFCRRIWTFRQSLLLFRRHISFFAEPFWRLAVAEWSSAGRNRRPRVKKSLAQRR